MGKETLNTSIEDLLVIINERMNDKERLYYHCMDCGIIYRNKIEGEYFNPLIDWYKLTGKKSLDWNILKREITTGICKTHYEERMNELKQI